MNAVDHVWRVFLTETVGWAWQVETALRQGDTPEDAAEVYIALRRWGIPTDTWPNVEHAAIEQLSAFWMAHADGRQERRGREAAAMRRVFYGLLRAGMAPDAIIEYLAERSRQSENAVRHLLGKTAYELGRLVDDLPESQIDAVLR
jgi:hypothetical protein